LTMRITKSTERIDFDERGETARPWNVCVRLIRDTAPCKEADKNLLGLHMEVLEQFRYLAPIIPVYERHAIYRECAQQIAERSTKATGNFKVICMFLHTPHADATFWEQNADLMRLVLEEIPTFISKATEDGDYQYRMAALQNRLDLLRINIVHHGMAIPVDLYQNLWEHTIGPCALSNDARDLAWSLFSMAYSKAPHDDFCNQLVSSYIATMDPQFYTPGLFDFVTKFDFPMTRQKFVTEQGHSTILQIPGAELLWRFILFSPPGTIEDRAAHLLASRYVQVADRKDILPSEFENAQVALADQCMQELRNAIASLSRLSQGSAQSKSTVDTETTARRLTESRISRILLFQKLLLELVRQRPEFNRGRRVDSKVDEMESDVPFGDGILVKYQFGNERQSVTMGSDHTMDDLYRRLCHTTGYTKLNLFARGQRLKMFEGPPIRLSEFDFGGQVIVQKADGAELTRPLPGLAAGSSRFENAIVRHFEQLFAWMDHDDAISYHVSDLCLQPMTKLG
jgi:ubiquitin carboxyl-terminal hydrolase 34